MRCPNYQVDTYTVDVFQTQLFIADVLLRKTITESRSEITYKTTYTGYRNKTRNPLMIVPYLKKNTGLKKNVLHIL